VTVLENIDSNSADYLFNSLDLKNTAFLVVSKSGKTVECISLTLLLMGMLRERFGTSVLARNFFFLTENGDNPLSKLAKEFSIETIEHDSHIGGRFSYLSNVAMIPASVAGMDLRAIRGAAAALLDSFFLEEGNFIVDVCAKQCELYRNGTVGAVMMPYSDRLRCLTTWYGQLMAESLGKDGFGVIPFPALGTIDQHSQLQLYMDGPKNLFFSIITKRPGGNSLKITDPLIESFNYLKNKTLDEIMNIEAESTVEVLNRRGLAVRTLEMEKLDEASLSQIMMHSMLEVIMIGNSLGINPFGQPAVEERKILAQEMLAKL
jgi:glucose-6-phosphate isomerase